MHLRTLGLAFGTLSLALLGTVAASNPGAASTGPDLNRLGAYAAVPVVRAQDGINAPLIKQKSVVLAVQDATHRVQQLLESTPGVPPAALQHAAAANGLADDLAANPGNDSTALTTAIQTTANAAAATVQDLLQSTNSDSGPIDISTAPELRDELTPDPELGLAPRCSVIPFGCVEHAHGDGPNGPVTNEGNNYGTPNPLPVALNNARQPACNLNTSTRVQVIYGYYSSVGNQRSTYYSSIATMAAEMDDWVMKSAQKTGGARNYHFVMNSDCTLNLPSLAFPSTAYNPYAGWGAFTTTLANAGYKSTTTKYLVFLDNPNDGSGTCGAGTAYADTRPDPALNYANGHSTTVGYAYVVKGCWDTWTGPTTNNAGADTADHEMGHILGAVQPSAPGGTSGFHCWDGKDRMCYNDGSANSEKYSDYYCIGLNANELWDCKNDTYFAAVPAGTWLPTHWNLYKSSFLY